MHPAVVRLLFCQKRISGFYGEFYGFIILLHRISCALLSLFFYILTFAPDNCSAAPNVDIIFVTQPPHPQDFATINSTFGNHQASMSAAPRGGDLYIRYADGTLKNLTQAAGYGQSGMQGITSIAVRDPSVHWNSERVIFSMAIGAPTQRYQVKEYRWQLYEIINLKINETPVITKVTNQQTQYNNVMPIYGTDGRIIFASDRPRNNQIHLYPQLDEYESTPTNTGLWSLNPTDGNIFLLDHSPSGDFNPSIDSFGRVIFTRWDHLQRDQQNLPAYKPFNFTSEGINSEPTSLKSEVFPEPRSNGDPDKQANLNLHTINQFFPWMINENGTALETMNHIGRQELHGYIEKTFNDDPALKEYYGQYSRFNQNDIDNMFNIKEDPLHPGEYFGINAPEFQTHASGQIVKLYGEPGLTADKMHVDYITHPDTSIADETPSVNHSGLYRDATPLSDGSLLAVHTTFTGPDSNIGSSQEPISKYDFRIKTLKKVGSYWIEDTLITSEIRKTISFWNPDTLITYNNILMWELQPVELKSRIKPSVPEKELENPEKNAFNQANVVVDSLKQFLKGNDLALIISRNVTSRDALDLQQPFNLKISETNTETKKNNGKLYDIKDLQIFQGDLIRGYGDINSPKAGRRVLAQSLHDAVGFNPVNSGGPAGSVKISSDGSVAAFVPARRALSWQLTGNQSEGVIRERYWLTFQPGEIRVCASCHGLNSKDQAGGIEPTNSPLALVSLLNWWKQASPDSDGDGLLDSDEVNRGTNPNSADSDQDGINDGKEVSDGTDPLDKGSRKEAQGSSTCAEWNGYLGGMWNVLEQVNLTSKTLNLTDTLFGITGSPESTWQGSVTPNAQSDLLVHDMPGWKLNSYGKICINASNASAGELDGRMIYYKPRAGSFDFALSMPFTNGIKGSQSVAFNTYQPSLDPKDSNNFIANWIQLTNLESSTQGGIITFFDMDGTILGSQGVLLAGGARQDYSGHQFGINKVGQALWNPSDTSARFQIRNVRYFYDNPDLKETFASAFQLEGQIGTGANLIVPIDTRSTTAVLEISNTSNSTISANVNIRSSSGAVLYDGNIPLNPKASYHLIVDGILKSAIGTANVKSSAKESLIVTAMHYGRTSSGGIKNIYGILGKEPLGTKLQGSYNSFLNQDCSLLISNPKSQLIEAQISMTKYDGQKVLDSELIEIPPFGTEEFDLCEHDPTNSYGVVTIDANRGNSVVASILRVAGDESYKFPTEVRE